MKAYIIIAYDGTEIIDGTPEAEIRIAAMNDLEERIKRERKRKSNQMRRRRSSKNLLWKLVCACRIV